MHHVLAVLVELLMTVLPAQTPSMVWQLTLELVNHALALLLPILAYANLVTHHVLPALVELLMIALPA